MYGNNRFIITNTSKYVEKTVLEAEVATSIEAGEATTICELGTLVEGIGELARRHVIARAQNCTAWAKRPLQLGGGEAGECYRNAGGFRKQKIRLLGLLLHRRSPAPAAIPRLVPPLPLHLYTVGGSGIQEGA